MAASRWRVWRGTVAFLGRSNGFKLGVFGTPAQGTLHETLPRRNGPAQPSTLPGDSAEEGGGEDGRCLRLAADSVTNANETRTRPEPRKRPGPAEGS